MIMRHLPAPLASRRLLGEGLDLHDPFDDFFLRDILISIPLIL